jgi:hypothetical protein
MTQPVPAPASFWRVLGQPLGDTKVGNVSEKI